MKIHGEQRITYCIKFSKQLKLSFSSRFLMKISRHQDNKTPQKRQHCIQIIKTLAVCENNNQLTTRIEEEMLEENTLKL